MKKACGWCGFYKEGSLAKTSPTQRSLAMLRERGMLAEVVERWNPYTKTRKERTMRWLV